VSPLETGSIFRAASNAVVAAFNPPASPVPISGRESTLK